MAESRRSTPSTRVRRTGRIFFLFRSDPRVALFDKGHSSLCKVRINSWEVTRIEVCAHGLSIQQCRFRLSHLGSTVFLREFVSDQQLECVAVQSRLPCRTAADPLGCSLRYVSLFSSNGQLSFLVLNLAASHSHTEIEQTPSEARLVPQNRRGLLRYFHSADQIDPQTHLPIQRKSSNWSSS